MSSSTEESESSAPGRTSSLIRGSTTYLIANLANAAIPFILLPILTRELNPAEYGLVAVFQALVSATAALVGLSVVSAANRKYFDNDITRSQLASYIGCCIYLVTFTGVLIFVGTLSTAEYIQGLFGIPVMWIAIAVCTAVALTIKQLRLGQWQVAGFPLKYGTMQIGSSTSNMLLSLLLVLTFNFGAQGRILAVGTTELVFALLSITLLFRDQLLDLTPRVRLHLREILHFGVPLVPHAIGMFLLSSADRLVISKTLGLSEAGIYLVALQIASAISLFFDAASRAYTPWVYARLTSGSHADKLLLVKINYAAYMLILGCGFVLGMAIPTLVQFLAGEEYMRSAEVAVWLVIGQCFYGMYLTVNNYIFYARRTALLSLITIVSGTVGVTMLIYLTEILGLKGAAFGYTASMALRFLLTWFLAQRCYPLPWLTIFTRTDKKSTKGKRE